MRRHLTLFAIALPLLLARGTRGDDAAPRLVFDQKDCLFEKTVQGRKVAKTFTFKNAGNAELVIRKVETSCGCTVGKVTKDHLAPGEQGSIELVLDTADKIGASIMVRATVFSNDAKEQGIGPCTTILELKGEVVSNYVVRPTGMWFGQVQRGKEEVVRELRVYGDLDAKKEWKVLAIENVPEWCKLESRPLDAPEFFGELKGWAFKARLLPHVPAGEFLHYVTVKTDVESQPSFRFPLVGVALNAIRPLPEAVVFERVKRGNEVERAVQIERVDDKKGLTILAIEYDERLISVTPQVVIEGTRIDLMVKLRKDAPPGILCTDLVVKLDDATVPLLRWPVFADVRARVAPDPPLILLRGQQPATITVPVDGGVLKAATATPADAFDVALEPATPEGRPAHVKVTPKRALQPKEKATLVLESDVPGEEKTLVPIEAGKSP
jgi:hypothetical protein